MRLVIKIVGYAIVVLLALLLVTGLAVKFFFDPNDYRDDIAAVVKAKTGRDLTIDGDLGLSIFPWLAIDMGHARLSNAPGFGDKPFAEIDSASLSLRLIPLLLRREIELGTIGLNGLVLNLARNKEGRTNWDDLLKTAEEAPPPAETKDEEGFQLSALSVGGLAVEDASISWTDRQAGTSYELTKFAFNTGTLTPGEPFKFTNSFELSSKSPPLDLSSRLGGTATVDLESNTYSVEGFKLSFKASGEAAPANPTEGDVSAKLLRLDLDKQTMALEKFAANVLGLDVEGELRGQRIVDNPRVNGEIAVAQFNGRKLLERLGTALDTADPDALTRVSLASKIAYQSGGKTSFEDMRLALDQSEIKGVLSVGAASELRFDLVVDEIDLDRYLPPDEGKTEEEADSAAPSDEVEVPVDLVRALDAEGKVQVGKARLSGLKLESVELALKAANGRIRVHPLQSAFYGGTYRGDIRLDVNPRNPVLRLDEHVENAQIGDLARDLYKQEKLSGTTRADLALTARGQNLGQMRRSLSGDVGFKVEKGAIEGFNLWHEISKARALFDKDMAGKASKSAPDRTEFSNISGTGVVKNGVVTTRDLAAQLPFLNVSGEGTIDLVEDQVDLRVRAVVVDSPELEAQAAMADLKGTAIPVKITGDTFAPKIRPDFGSLAKQEIEKKKDEAKAKVKDKILDKIGIPKESETAEAEGEVASAQTEPEDKEEPQDPEEQLKDDAKRKLLKKIFD